MEGGGENDFEIHLPVLGVPDNPRPAPTAAEAHGRAARGDHEYDDAGTGSAGAVISRRASSAKTLQEDKPCRPHPAILIDTEAVRVRSLGQAL